MKQAFSLIELIFAIVIIGILAGIGINKMNFSNFKEDIETTMENIKYTQFLSLNYDVNGGIWSIEITKNNLEIINVDNKDITIRTPAKSFFINPLDLNSKLKKGFTNVIITDEKKINQTLIQFNNFGIPLMQYHIKLQDLIKSACIIVEKNTGYVYEVECKE